MSYKEGETVEERRARWRKAYTRLDMAKRNATKRKYNRGDRGRQKAHNAIFKARGRGEIPSPKELCCVSCGQPALEYHHPNGYEGVNALEVVAVCRPCHKVMDGYTAGKLYKHYTAPICQPCQPCELSQE